MITEGVSRRRVLGLGGAMAALSMTGCGAGSRTAAQTAVRTGCSFPEPARRTDVRVLAYNSSAIDPFTNAMMVSCSHGTVDVLHDPIDFAGQVQKTQATLGVKDGTYDIIESYGFVVPSFAATRKVLPLDAFLKRYEGRYAFRQLNPTFLRSLQFEGRTYGLPMQAQMQVMAYRKDILDSLGLTAPRTFAELRTAARRIQDSGTMKHPLVMPMLVSGDLITAHQCMLGALDTPYVDPRTRRPQMDTPAAIRALQELKALRPYMDPQVGTFSQVQVQQQVFNGTAAIAIMFSGRMNDLTRSEYSRYADRMAFAPAPRLRPGGKYYGSVSVDGWSLPSNSTVDPDLLFQIIAASVNPDVSRAATPAAFPARDDVLRDPRLTRTSYIAAAREALRNSPPIQPYAWMPLVTNDLLPIVANAFTGTIGVQAAARQMQAQATTDMAAFR